MIVAVGLVAGTGYAVGSSNGETQKLAQQPPERGAINGTAKLKQDGDTVYTIVCLPRNYRSCAPCVALVNAFNSDRELIDVRRQSRYWVYVDGDPDFDHRWKRLLPEVAAGKSVVCMTQGGRLLYKQTSPPVRGLGGRLKQKMIDKFCPKCEPDEGEEPPLVDTTPVMPPIIGDTEPDEEDGDSDMPVVMALGALGLVAGWGLMFRRGV
jgi:hypothetical protein